MTSPSIKKQFDKYFPLLSHKQQALVLDLVKSFLNIDADDNPINYKQYHKELAEAVDWVEDGGFVTQENTKKELSKLEPMSMSSFHKMIDLAIQDHDAGRVISHKDLKKKVKTWK